MSECLKSIKIAILWLENGPNLICYKICHSGPVCNPALELPKKLTLPISYTYNRDMTAITGFTNEGFSLERSTLTGYRYSNEINLEGSDDGNEFKTHC